MRSAKIKERELIIKLHNECKNQEYIAEIVSCSQPKVSFWIRRYKKTGIFEDKLKIFDVNFKEIIKSFFNFIKKKSF